RERKAKVRERLRGRVGKGHEPRSLRRCLIPAERSFVEGSETRPANGGWPVARRLSIRWTSRWASAHQGPVGAPKGRADVGPGPHGRRAGGPRPSLGDRPLPAAGRGGRSAEERAYPRRGALAPPAPCPRGALPPPVPPGPLL